jgi:4-amino-4-deoxy-L-arabinose transferase-like glycosyltransferase
MKSNWPSFLQKIKKENLILIGLFCIAILFRLILMTKTFVIGFDEVNYLKLAADAHINGFKNVMHTYWPPLYPLFVSIVSYFISNYETAGRIASMLINSAIIFPLFYFIKRQFNQNLAYLTAALMACYTIYAQCGVVIETEALYTFLAVTGICLGWYALNDRKLYMAVFTGVLFGGAYLTRPEGIGFIMVFIGLTLVMIGYQLFTRGKTLIYFFVLLLSIGSFVLVAFPYLNYLHKSTGQWTISSKGLANQLGEMYLRTKPKDAVHPYHLVIDNNTRLIQDEIYHLGNFIANMKLDNELKSDVSIFDIAKKLARQNYQIMTKEFLKVFSLPIVILIVLGLFAVPWSRKDALVNGYLASYVVFFWFVLIPSFHIVIRYFVPLIPIASIWLITGGYRMQRWLKETFSNFNEFSIPSRWLSILSTMIVLVIIIGGVILPDFVKFMKNDINSTEEWSPAIEQKKAGLWLKQNGVKHPIVMAYNHAVSFYAGNYKIAESVEIPEDDINPILAYAKFRGVNYIVLNDRYKHVHPRISFLYEGVNIPVGLKQIYFDQESNGLSTRIYELLN